MRDDLLDDIDFPDSQPDPADMEYYMEVFIGQGADAYVKKWKQGNWARFRLWHMLLGGVWLLYRKMYLLPILLFFFPVVLFPGRGYQGDFFYMVPIFGLIKAAFDCVAGGFFVKNLLATIVVMWVCGVRGERVYLAHSEKHVKRLLSTHAQNKEKFLDELSKSGGVEPLIPLILLLFAFMSFLFAADNFMHYMLDF